MLIQIAVGTAMLCAPASAKVLMTQDEALASAFGAATPPTRRTAFLTEDQAERVRALSGTSPGSRIVIYYAGGPDPSAPLTAYFDTHVVRTFPETIQVVIDPAGRVSRVDILSFDEPEDYLPKKRWLDQFTGRPLNDDLSLSGGIRPVAGATLS